MLKGRRLNIIVYVNIYDYTSHAVLILCVGGCVRASANMAACGLGTGKPQVVTSGFSPPSAFLSSSVQSISLAFERA